MRRAWCRLRPCAPLLSRAPERRGGAVRALNAAACGRCPWGLAAARTLTRRSAEGLLYSLAPLEARSARARLLLCVEGTQRHERGLRRSAPMRGPMYRRN